MSYIPMMLDTGRIPLTGDALNWFRQGLSCASAGEFERALANYSQLLKLRPDFYEGWYERGLVLENIGFYTEAIASYDHALQLCSRDKFNSDVWNDRGNALQYGLGNYQAALECYDRSLRLDPNHEMAWHNRGNTLLYGLNLLDEALASYNRALQLNPSNYLTWRNRGNVLIEQNRYSEAITSYDHALALQPTDEVSRQARNLAAQQTGLTGMRQPTTRPVWYAQDESPPTLIENAVPPLPREVAEFDINTRIVPVQPTLVVEDDDGQREIGLIHARYTIGRDPKNDICLYSQFASRYHAVLERIDQNENSYTYQIRDGDATGKPSTNGIFVNGHKQQSLILKADDAIVFGPKVRATYQMPIAGFGNPQN
jgi:tetratricopeptide (TPR) repeat protein